MLGSTALAWIHYPVRAELLLGHEAKDIVVLKKVLIYLNSLKFSQLCGRAFFFIITQNLIICNTMEIIEASQLLPKVNDECYHPIT